MGSRRSTPVPSSTSSRARPSPPAPSYTITLHGLANLSVFSASYYHKVSKDVEAGAKVNNAGVLGLGYTQALRPGLKLSFGLAVDTKAFSSSEVAASAAHKVGSALTFEA